MKIKVKHVLLTILSISAISFGCTKSEPLQPLTDINTITQSAKDEDKFSMVTPSYMTLTKGQTFKFNARIQLKDGSYSRNIMWTSTNPYAVQSSFDGWVNAMNEGFATITATAREDFTKTARATVNVVKFKDSSKK